MGDSNNLIHVGKFNGKDFRQWKFQIKCALRAKCVYEVAIGETPKPSGNTAEDREKIYKWNKDDALAMCILTSAMELTQISLIETCESACEILNKLDSIYEQKSETNKMLVHERFYQYQMQESDTVAQHIAKIESLARQIKESGDAISNIAIVTKILSTLPSKYHAFRQAWLSLDETKQTIANLTARLLDEESNLNRESETDGARAMAASESISNSTKKHFQKSKITCFNCSKKGHFASECRAPSKNRQTTQSTSKTTQKKKGKEVLSMLK